MEDGDTRMRDHRDNWHIPERTHPHRSNSGLQAVPASRRRTNRESLKSFGFEWGRLKTGTPPRLIASIDFELQVERGTFRRELGDIHRFPFRF